MIEDRDLMMLDARYVKHDDCDSKHEKIDGKMNEYEKDHAVLIAKFNTLIKILSAIGVSVLGIAVKLLFGG